MARRFLPISFAAAGVVAAVAGIASGCGAKTDDATPDAAAPDGSPADDAPVDAPAHDGAIVDADAGDAGRFCTTLPVPHDFCEDFEDALFFGTTRWTRPYLGGAGRLRVDNGALVSEILEHDTDSGNANHPAALLIERDWSVPAEKGTRRLSLSYRVKIDDCNAVMPIAFLGGVDRGAYYSYSAWVQFQQDVDCTASVRAFFVEPDGGAIIYPVGGAAIPISVGSAIDYALTLEEVAGTTTMALTARGMTSTTSFPSVARGDIVTAVVGASRSWVDGTPVRLDFDDILFDYGR